MEAEEQAEQAVILEQVACGGNGGNGGNGGGFESNGAQGGNGQGGSQGGGDEQGCGYYGGNRNGQGVKAVEEAAVVLPNSQPVIMEV